MRARAALRLAWPGLLVLLAALGPYCSGPVRTPSVGASATQLLPPGSRVQELRLADGGFVRGLELASGDGQIRVRGPVGWRSFPGVASPETLRERTLWLGTDHQARDLLARMLFGARTSLTVAIIASLIALTIGTGVGLAQALLPAPGRRGITVATDGLLGLPRLLLLLLLGLLFRPLALGVGVAIGLASWMEVSRLVASEAASLSRRPFFAAVRASGAGRVRIAVRHLLPNLRPVIRAATPLVAAEAILLESTLSFLGVAGGTGSESWGRMIADGQRLLPQGWWIAVLPGVLLSLTALAFHRGAAIPDYRRTIRAHGGTR